MNTFNDLKTSLTWEDVDELTDLLTTYCRQKTKARLKTILTYGKNTIPSAGIFDRLTKSSYGWHYCAAQSYTDEIRTLRNLILNG